MTAHHSITVELPQPSTGLQLASLPHTYAAYVPDSGTDSDTDSGIDSGTDSETDSRTDSVTDNTAGSGTASVTDAADLHYSTLLLRRAFESWQGHVLHMARCRTELQQAAVAIADQAIKSGCQAAAVEALSWKQPAAAAPICNNRTSTGCCQVAAASLQPVRCSHQLLVGSQPPQGSENHNSGAMLPREAANSLRCVGSSRHAADSPRLAAASLSLAAASCGVPSSFSSLMAASSQLAAASPADDSPALQRSTPCCQLSSSFMGHVTFGQQSGPYIQHAPASHPHFPGAPQLVAAPDLSLQPRRHAHTDVPQQPETLLMQRALSSWHQVAQRAVAELYLQHERKACVNAELVQVRAYSLRDYFQYL